MQFESRLAIHTEKQLKWAWKFGGTESLEISRAEETVLTRLMESQVWHQPFGPVALWLCGVRVQKMDNGLC